MLKKSKNHLESVSESYFEHMAFALQIGFCMIAGGAATVLHALCPGVFQHTGSLTIARLQQKIAARVQPPPQREE